MHVSMNGVSKICQPIMKNNGITDKTEEYDRCMVIRFLWYEKFLFKTVECHECSQFISFSSAGLFAGNIDFIWAFSRHLKLQFDKKLELQIDCMSSYINVHQ